MAMAMTMAMTMGWGEPSQGVCGGPLGDDGREHC